MWNKIIELYTYILITDSEDEHFLQNGRVEDIEYYFDGDVKQYTVRFADGLFSYEYDLDEHCKEIVFK